MKITDFLNYSLGTLLLIFSFGCSQKSSFTLGQIMKTGSAVSPVESEAAVFDSSLLQVSSGTISLKSQYTRLDTFNDNTAGNWTTSVTAIGGSFATGPDFSLGSLSFSSLTDWVGLADSGTAVTNYVQLFEVNASVLDGANTLSSCMRMQANFDDHYRFTIAGGNLEISSRATSAFSSLGTTAASLTPTTGSNYFVKTSSIGSSLGMRVWEVGTAEPTADQISVTDTTYASGVPCLLFQAAQTAVVDNIRIGPAAFESDYSRANPSFVFPNIDQRAGIAAVSSTITKAGSDDVKFDVSIDDGASYLFWDGSAWTTNLNGYADANPLATMSAAIANLGRSGTGYIKIRAHLHSELGYSSPTLSNLEITYR